ncbi:hypothetical protein QJS66_22655 [Kocuria rhizophila]|nr:hypothetical protein QJS66_22655 [Kocuria rhizophila]
MDGEWRISQAPDGAIIPDTDFAQIFPAVYLHFYSANDSTTPVPLALVRQAATASTAAVRGC